MNTQIRITRPQSPRERAARERLRAASLALEEAIAAQKTQVRELQGNLNTLDSKLDDLRDSFVRAAD